VPCDEHQDPSRADLARHLRGVTCMNSIFYIIGVIVVIVVILKLLGLF
jgi:hypothetical protein